MRARLFVLLITGLALGGCDRLTGAAQQKILDAEAIGYACRVSQKMPEDCMQENETQSPSSILDGWKAADQDIQQQNIHVAAPAAHAATPSASAAADVKAAADKPAAKKPAEAPAKPGNAGSEKKATP
jgi:hypothetical protein